MQQLDSPSFFLLIVLIYLSSFTINTIITQMQLSEKPKAAWVFFTAPLAKPGQVISGAFKAMVAKFLLPVFVVVSVIAMVLTAGKAAPHLLVGFSNVLMTSSLFAYLFLRKFPFSTPIQTNARTGNLVLSILITLLPFGVGVLHAFIRDSWIGLTLMGLVSISLTFLLLQQMQKREWSSILSTYSEE